MRSESPVSVLRPTSRRRRARITLTAAVATWLGLAGGLVNAQDPDENLGPVDTTPRVGVAVHDESPPLREMPMIRPKPGPTIREMGRPGGEEEEEAKVLKSGPASRPAVETFEQRTFLESMPAPAMPATLVNFNGLGNVDGVLPPDTNGDVGPNHYVQTVNSAFQIFNKSGGSVFGPAEINTLWQGFGGNCQASNDGDPIVLYDSIADRWLISQFTASNPFGECVAISTTPDPTGTYFRYFFQFSTSIFYDYPHLGVWPDGYYMGANKFNGNTFAGAAIIALERDKMLLGQTARFKEFGQLDDGALLPSDLDGATLPPAGAPNTFASMFDLSTMRFYKFHVDWTNLNNSTLSAPISVPITAFTQLCPTTRGCVDQPSTTVNLDGLGDRLMHRLAYRNFGDHESLVVTHSLDQNSGAAVQSAVRWYEFRNPGTTPTLFQSGTFVPDTSNRWMGSIAMDRDGNMALGYSVSSASVFPSIRYTGRLAGDPVGQLPQGETTMIAGTGSQTHSASRWGDYAMMTIDPVDDCTFWFTTEYMVTTSSADWKTRIASFKFPSCGGGPTPTSTPVLPTATRTSTSPPVATGTPTRTSTPAPPTNTPTITPIPPTATATPPSVPGCSASAIAIPDNGAANPYPSTINISGASGLITKVTVDLSGIAHTFPDDIDVLVVGPAGQNAIVMSDVGGSGDVTGVNLTLDDAAAPVLPDNGPLVSGTFKPTNATAGDTFPAGAPAPSGGSALSIFNGTNPNGSWRLYVADDAAQDLGQFANGWCVHVTTGVVPPTATNTPLPAATNTLTPVPATNTFTPVPPTSTATLVPPTSTLTPVPPTSTLTPVPPTGTATPVPATSTTTPSATGTPTSSAATATRTPTGAPGTPICQSLTLAIPDNNTTGVSTTQTVAGSGLIGDLNVSLNATHTWVGDLVVTLQHGTITPVTILVDRPGVPGSTFGCGGDNINATFDDQTTLTAESNCNSTSGLTTGPYKPNSLLSAFNGQDIQGVWKLSVSDRAAADTGTLLQWCLAPSSNPALLIKQPTPLPPAPTPTALSGTASLSNQLVIEGQPRVHRVDVSIHAETVDFGWEAAAANRLASVCQLSVEIFDPSGTSRRRAPVDGTRGEARFQGMPGVWSAVVTLNGCKQAVYRFDTAQQRSVPAIEEPFSAALALIPLAILALGTVLIRRRRREV